MEETQEYDIWRHMFEQNSQAAFMWLVYEHTQNRKRTWALWKIVLALAVTQLGIFVVVLAHLG